MPFKCNKGLQDGASVARRSVGRFTFKANKRVGHILVRKMHPIVWWWPEDGPRIKLPKGSELDDEGLSIMETHSIGPFW